MGRVTPRSRALRRTATQEEALLWHFLRDRRLGYKIRRQHPIGRFIVDFFCAEARLAIEIDGDHHNEYLDEIRDVQLVGVTMLRFTNREVNDNVFDVVAAIDGALKENARKLRGPSAPSPRVAWPPRTPVGERGSGGEA